TVVSMNKRIDAIFNEVMDSSTINSITFTLKQGTTPVGGAVTYSGTTASFSPLVNLFSNTTYTATITKGSKDP
ncbi:MAG TPA: Ig-like domain-containing protein, partial [Puia sp.]|nr:Ig-like domain-containing protein [Puia sp.]